MSIKSEAELGQALKANVDTIEIEGNLVTKVVRIKATGTVAWAVAIGAIGLSVTAIVISVPTAGTSTTVAGIAAVGGAAVLGPAAGSAIAIAVAAGGVASLNKLRRYKVVEKGADRIVLQRS